MLEARMHAYLGALQPTPTSFPRDVSNFTTTINYDQDHVTLP